MNFVQNTLTFMKIAYLKKFDTSMTRIKASFNDRMFAKHILNCGLHKPMEKYILVCNYIQNMFRKIIFDIQQGIIFHMSQNLLF